MPQLIWSLLGAVIGAGGGYALSLILQRLAAARRAETERAALEAATKAARAQAEAEGRAALDQQRRAQADEADRVRKDLERLETRLRRQEETLAAQEATVDGRAKVAEERQAALDRREAKILKREEQAETRDQALDEREQKVATGEATIAQRLGEVAQLTPEQARERLFARLDTQLADEQGAIVARWAKEVENRKQELAQEVIARAIQRYASEHTAETTVAVVKLPDDDMKGRIIGKEGRNIRAFELAAGVDLIIDDTPGQITISCFDGVRREIARRALAELLADGRIQPARIEEVLAKTQQEMERIVFKLGEDAAFACDISGLHPQLLKMLGKLHYRTSYGQNVLQHSTEVAHLAGAMAAELDLDVKLAKRCGLLHDLGKALDHESEGSHPELGREALQRFGENKVVAAAAAQHHEGYETTGIYTVLTAAADAISAARPGARRENIERYLKRLEQLEDIACSFEGVTKAYAIQAGREVRVIINGHALADKALPKVAHDIARRIETDVAYPGEVKVTVIREMRTTAIAK